MQYLQNKKFANMNLAGKFEVLRIEIGGVTIVAWILFGFIQEDFDIVDLITMFPILTQ